MKKTQFYIDIYFSQFQNCGTLLRLIIKINLYRIYPTIKEICQGRAEMFSFTFCLKNVDELYFYKKKNSKVQQVIVFVHPNIRIMPMNICVCLFTYVCI